MKNESAVLDDDEVDFIVEPAANVPLVAKDFFATKIPVKANAVSDVDVLLKVQEVLADALEFGRDEINMHDAFEHDLEMKPEDEARIIRGLEEEFRLPLMAINLIELKTVKALTTALKELLAQK